MSLFQRILGRSAPPAADNGAWLTDQAMRVSHQLAQQAASTLTQASRRSFESAETKPWTDSWATHSSDINELLSRQLPAMRSRAKGLARNDEWATRFQIQLEDNVLGEQGILLQMRVKGPDGKFDKATNDALEAHWVNWGEDCEVSGMCWQEVESLLLNCEERCGEYLYRLRPGRGRFGFQIQLLDPALLDVNLHRDWGGNRVRMGVEIDDDGVPLAYWLRASKAGDQNNDITTVGKHVRVPADQIRHRFVRTEIGQLRGIPGLSVGARRLWQLHDFEESANVATSNAAKRQGFFVSPDGNAPPGFADTIVSAVLAAAQAEGKTLTAEELATLQATAQKFATTVPGQFDTIPQGYEFQPFESKWPDISAEGYIKSQIRGWSAARGVSYHTLGNDLESVNYSSAQVGIGDERLHFKRRQQRQIRWLHAEVGPEVFKRAPLYDSSLLASRIPDYLAAITWRPRTWPAIDPLKAAEANDIRLRNRSTSRRQIWLSEGLDADDMEREVLEDDAKFGRLETPKDAGTSNKSQRHDDDDRPTDRPRARLAAVPGGT